MKDRLNSVLQIVLLILRIRRMAFFCCFKLALVFFMRIFAENNFLWGKEDAFFVY